MAAFGQMSKIDNIWRHNYISAKHLDLLHPIWTKIGIDIVFDPKQQIDVVNLTLASPKGPGGRNDPIFS